MGKKVKEWAVIIAIAVGLTFVVMQFVQATVVNGTSMLPTFENGDYLFLSKQSYHLFGGEPEHGDIVVVQSRLPDGNGGEKMIIKRVIGIEGDTIEIKGGYVYRNGEKVNEDYILEPGQTAVVSKGSIDETATYKVPKGKVFILGDNRNNSTDSRSSDVGYVSIDDIKGKVMIRIFPFSKISLF